MDMGVSEIRSILLEVWDPLSVGGNAKLSDEYDAFIPVIRKALASGAEEGALVELLMRLERDLGVDPSVAASRAAARAFLAS
jgi:hypothetical protein